MAIGWALVSPGTHADTLLAPAIGAVEACTSIGIIPVTEEAVLRCPQYASGLMHRSKRRDYQVSQRTTVSKGARQPGLKSVPCVYATGIRPACITSS